MDKISIVVPSSSFGQFVFRNIYKADATDKVWNTGLSTANDPHADENYAYAGLGLIDGTDDMPYKKGAVAIRLFKTNQEVVLNPGDDLKITPSTKEEVLYYLAIKSELLDVTVPEGIVIVKSVTVTGETTTVEAESDVTFTVAGTGVTLVESTAESSDETKATVAVAGTTVTVSGVAEGSATITVVTTTEDDGEFVNTLDITVTAKQ